MFNSLVLLHKADTGIEHPLNKVTIAHEFLTVSKSFRSFGLMEPNKHK